jgi:MFS family permease
MEIQNTQKTSYPGKWGAILVIGLGVFMGTLDMSIVNISLPTLVEQLQTNFATVQWVVPGYALVIASTMLRELFSVSVSRPHNEFAFRFMILFGHSGGS